MTKPRYQISLALSKEDEDLKNELVKKGYSLIDIFRKGLEALKDINR